MNNKKYIAIIILVLLCIIGAYYLGANKNTVQQDQVATSSSSPLSATSTLVKDVPLKPVAQKSPSAPPSSLSGSYTNAEHGFRIRHTDASKVTSSFSTFHELGTNWRLFANPYNQGKGVVQINIFTVDQGIYSTGKQTYPLYYTSQVRVGVGSNTAECYAKDGDGQKVSDTTINGVTFKKFSTSQLIDKKYVVSESYRTIRNNKCYAIEQIKNGTTYKDTLMKEAHSDAALEAYYKTASAIAQSFVFTK